MVAFNLKATIVALVFAVILGGAGLTIRRIFTFLYMDAGEPAWTNILWILVPGGLIGGWLLGWWLVTS
jgi:hypothetical protein